MLADAVRAEGYRLSKNRGTLFWCLLFVPLMGIVFSAIGNVFLKANAEKLSGEKMPPEMAVALAGGPVEIWQGVVSTAGDLANPVVLLFLLIGAATLYAGDYRWESWRLISARNGRINLVLGKLGVFAVLALAAMVLLLIGAVGENLIKAAVMGSPLAFTLDGDDIGRFFAFFGLSWLRILQFSMMALLAAVLTRSLLAALFVPLVVGVAQFFSPNALASMGFGPDSWPSVLINPGAAFDAFKALATGGAAAALLPEGLIAKAIVSAAFWTAAPLAGALALFRRQDLSKE